jgi:hypothetical protein
MTLNEPDSSDRVYVLDVPSSVATLWGVAPIGRARVPASSRPTARRQDSDLNRRRFRRRHRCDRVRGLPQAAQRPHRCQFGRFPPYTFVQKPPAHSEEQPAPSKLPRSTVAMRSFLPTEVCRVLAKCRTLSSSRTIKATRWMLRSKNHSRFSTLRANFHHRTARHKAGLAPPTQQIQ